MVQICDEKLLNAARRAALLAYAPYSGFAVGAALLCKNGKIYTGFNIENASFSLTICAERTAFFKALGEGEREFAAIAVVGGKAGDFSGECMPCGACRQVMAEFCGKDHNSEGFRIVTVSGEYALDALLPGGFQLK